MTPLLLEVKNLKTKFKVDGDFFYPVDDLSLHIKAGQTLGIVGESGCGKSATSLSIMRLLQKHGLIESGEVLLQGKDLTKLSEVEMQGVRGKDIAMIFQEPMSALNPVLTIGSQIFEGILVHNPLLKKSVIKTRVLDLLKKVGMASPETLYHSYPHQLSGGMRQRVIIAMAISCQPKVLIADEPTTSLDVTIQAQILDLLRDLQKDTGVGLLLITHDLGVIAEMCEDVVVMYAGKIVEVGSVEDIFYRPKHPYTHGLLKSMPQFEKMQNLERLNTIPGIVPSLSKVSKGCRFADRCFKAKSICFEVYPQSENLRAGQKVSCHYPITAEEQVKR